MDARKISSAACVQDNTIMLEFGGLFIIPSLSFLVLLWDTSIYSTSLFILSLLISHELLQDLNRKKTGLKIFEEIKTLAKGAVYADTNEPAAINWYEVDKIRIYDIKTDDLSNKKKADFVLISTLANIAENANQSFYYLITKNGRIFRGILSNEKEKNILKANIIKRGLK
ncbi:MAG: hypothetical protein B6U97_04050 [Candidatus Altiarchaeales archaeon ex4484_96]|nr:MAG: hypothetical protein B6U97_04050 [Candidatus Altiarchaeales archaeon ex4484_96]